MHDGKKIARLRSKLIISALHHRFQRRQQECQGSAQFMADIGEEPILYLVQLRQLFVALLEHGLAFIQLEPQGEFAKTGAAVKITAGGDDYSGQNEKIKIIEKF